MSDTRCSGGGQVCREEAEAKAKHHNDKAAEKRIPEGITQRFIKDGEELLRDESPLGPSLISMTSRSLPQRFR